MADYCIFTVMLNRISDVLQPKLILFDATTQVICFNATRSLVDDLGLERG